MSQNIISTLVYKYNSLNMKMNNEIIENSIKRLFWPQKKFLGNRELERISWK